MKASNFGWSSQLQPFSTSFHILVNREQMRRLPQWITGSPLTDGHLRSCRQIDFPFKCSCIFPDISASLNPGNAETLSRINWKTPPSCTCVPYFLPKKTWCRIFLHPRHKFLQLRPRCPGFAQLKGSRHLRLPESQRLPTRTADAQCDPQRLGWSQPEGKYCLIYYIIFT